MDHLVFRFCQEPVEERILFYQSWRKLKTQKQKEISIFLSLLSLKMYTNNEIMMNLNVTQWRPISIFYLISSFFHDNDNTQS